MCAKKARELEQLLSEKETELTALKQRLAEHDAKQGELQQREAAVVGALAEAQHAARRILDEAAANRDEIIALAQQEKEAAAQEKARATEVAQEEADRILALAKDQRDKLLAEAEYKANGIVERAKAEVREHQDNLRKLKDEITRAAAGAHAQAERFKQFLAGGIPAEADEDVPKVQPRPVELPSDYETPAELMHSIYAIQGRELPEQAEADIQDEPPVETEPEPEPETEPAQQVTAESEPEPVPEPERMWTVDEILSAQLDKRDELDLDGEIDLDALIDDLISKD